jgi:hypothetical protein
MNEVTLPSFDHMCHLRSPSSAAHILTPMRSGKQDTNGPFPVSSNGTLVPLVTILTPKNLVTSLRERTAQNVRSFNLSDRFERCANSFF